MSTQETNLKAIADAIREKDGTTTPIPAYTFAERIRAIETGGLPDNVRTITLTADPPEGGTVSGGGVASDGMLITISATANEQENFVFEGWKENSQIVSDIEDYSLVLQGNRDFTAVFVQKISRLPQGYTEVAYIECNGFSYLDTEIAINNRHRYVCDFEILNRQAISIQYIFAAVAVTYVSSKPFRTSIWVNVAASNGILLTLERGGSVIASDLQISTDTSSPVRHTINLDLPNHTVSVDGESKNFNPVYEFSNTPNMCLMGQYNNASSSIQGRLYSYQCYSSENLIQDLVPCINPDGIVGVFDMVENKFYKSGSDLDFIAGPAI